MPMTKEARSIPIAIIEYRASRRRNAALGSNGSSRCSNIGVPLISETHSCQRSPIKIRTTNLHPMPSHYREEACVNLFKCLIRTHSRSETMFQIANPARPYPHTQWARSRGQRVRVHRVKYGSDYYLSGLAREIENVGAGFCLLCLTCDHELVLDFRYAGSTIGRVFSFIIVCPGPYVASESHLAS